MYYFKPSGAVKEIGKAYTGLKTINNNLYYFSSKGVMSTGHTKIKKDYYFFKTNGVLGTKGKALTGWIESNGKMYYGTKSKKLAVSKFVNGYEITSTGALTNDSYKLKIQVRTLVNKLTSKAKTKKKKLKILYKHMMSRTYSYSHAKAIKPKKKNWRIKYSLDFLKTHKGACYHFGSTYTYMVAEIGYKTTCMNTGRHCWTNIKVNGKNYVSDPEVNRSYKDRSLFLVKYGSKKLPWTLYKFIKKYKCN